MPAGSAISNAITMPAKPSETVAGRRSSSVTVDRIAVAEADAEITGERGTDIAEELLDESAGRGRSPTASASIGLRRVAGAKRDAHGVTRHQMHE